MRGGEAQVPSINGLIKQGVIERHLDGSWDVAKLLAYIKDAFITHGLKTEFYKKITAVH